MSLMPCLDRMDEVTDYLLNRGAKTDIDDNIGRKALDMAASTPIYHGELKGEVFSLSLKGNSQ